MNRAYRTVLLGLGFDSKGSGDSGTNSAFPQCGDSAIPLILAVTVLTSLNDEDLSEIGVSGRVLDQALRLANLARAAGCDGIVASSREVRELRRELGEGFIIVTPGIRPAGAAQRNEDQERAATPAEAISAGASHIVVGRPITAAADPGAAARRILDEISAASQIPA